MKDPENPENEVSGQDLILIRGPGSCTTIEKLTLDPAAAEVQAFRRASAILPFTSMTESAWVQRTIVLVARPRGMHLVTGEIVQQLPEIGRFPMGLAHFFIQHTSASLALNENADPTVRTDLESHLNQMAPENAPYYRHTFEGPDDMPAHIKAVLIGSSLTIPISNGRLNLGTWQGIYLCEHRDRGGQRRLVVTLTGAHTG